jgi:hypothetical protein
LQLPHVTPDKFYPLAVDVSFPLFSWTVNAIPS